jgi:hypothetical protein
VLDVLDSERYGVCNVGRSAGEGSGEASVSDGERLRLVLRDSKKASFWLVFTERVSLSFTGSRNEVQRSSSNVNYGGQCDI